MHLTEAFSIVLNKNAFVNTGIHRPCEQWKQANVDANDGREKNEAKENLYRNYVSLWSTSCCFNAEECVDAESESGMEGS